MSEKKLHIYTEMLPKNEMIEAFLNSILHVFTLYSTSFSGVYTGLPHIDRSLDYNFYFMQMGNKEVIIVPKVILCVGRNLIFRN